MKRIKRMICLLLCACMVSTGIYVTDVEAANGVKKRIDSITSQFPSGTYFTANGKGCGHSSGSTCNNCRLSYVLASRGINYNSQICPDGWTCFAFASYCFGTIFGQSFRNATGVISSGIVSSNEGLYKAFSKAKIGDFVYCMNGNTVNHYAIFISCDTNGVTLLHNNIGGNGYVGKISYGYVPYTNLRGAGYGYNRVDIYRATNYSTIDGGPTDHAPEGYLDEAKGGVNKIYVRGWAYDPDAKGVPLWIHIYVDGKHVSTTKADKERTDVNNTIGCGKYHGYETTFEYKVGSTGTHKVEVYALNTNTSGVNTRLANSPKTVTVTADTTTPVISNVKVTPSADGYTITCNVTDPEGVDRVQFPTWTLKNGQAI